MGQTKVDPVDYAQMIVLGCLAREVCKTSSAGTQRDFTTTLRNVERHLDSVQIGALDSQRPQPIDDALNVNEPQTLRHLALVIFCLLSSIAIIARFVSVQ